MWNVLKFLASAPTAAKVGMFLLLMNLTAVAFAPWIAPYGETEVVGDVWEPGFWAAEGERSSDTIVLGTDQLGRDMFSRVVYGARNTIAIAVLTTALAFGMGIVGGFLAATLRGWVDQALSRSIDILMAFPPLILGLMVISVLGTSLDVMVGTIAVIEGTRVYRLSRAVAMDIEVMEYVEVAKLRGEGLWWVARHEILPNALPPLVAEFGLRFCFVFLFISALSFLGLGIQPPTADWGSMVRDNAAAISFGIVTPLIPGACIAILTVGVNLIVDWFLHKASGIREVQ